MTDWRAVHEAAHAVMVRRHGFVLTHLDLNRFSWRQRIEEPDFVEKYCDVMVAGGVATERWCNRLDTDKLDIERGMATLAARGVDYPYQHIVYAQKRVERIMDSLRPQIEAVALALESKVWLTEKEVDAAVNIYTAPDPCATSA